MTTLPAHPGIERHARPEPLELTYAPMHIVTKARVAVRPERVLAARKRALLRAPGALRHKKRQKPPSQKALQSTPLRLPNVGRRRLARLRDGPFLLQGKFERRTRPQSRRALDR